MIQRHFGRQAALLRFSRALWRRANLNPNESFRLTNIRATAAEADCDISDALAVLALLSKRSTGLLRMELRGQSPGEAMIEEEKLAARLQSWLRHRPGSDAEWREWASKVEINWVPTPQRAVAS
jgi:hypothetical protein